MGTGVHTCDAYTVHSTLSMSTPYCSRLFQVFLHGFGVKLRNPERWQETSAANETVSPFQNVSALCLDFFRERCASSADAQFHVGNCKIGQYEPLAT